jgi:hypothetical protein
MPERYSTSAAVDLLHQTLDRLPREDPCALFVDDADVGQDSHRRVDRQRALLPGEPEASPPAQPELVDPRDAAADRDERKRRRALAAGELDPRPIVLALFEQPIGTQRHLHARRRKARYGNIQLRIDLRADRCAARQRDARRRRIRPSAAQPVDQG